MVNMFPTFIVLPTGTPPWTDSVYGFSLTRTWSKVERNIAKIFDTFTFSQL